MISLRELKTVLADFTMGQIDLEIGAGEYFVLLGPTGAGKTVLLETIADNGYGLACVSGSTIVQIDVADETAADLADIGDGVSANLVTGTTGSARVLWRAGGTGVQWALVHMGGPDGGGAPVMIEAYLFIPVSGSVYPPTTVLISLKEDAASSMLIVFGEKS